MKRWVRVLCGVLAVCLVSSCLAFAGASEGIRRRVVRLHVLAHDDSEAEQALKLRVRDTVSDTVTALLGEERERDDVLARLREILPAVEAAAQQCVYDAGYAHPVRAELTDMYFTTREYDSGTYPAGVYEALRITIGDGAGRNWWCVLYPPLCVSAAMQAPTADEVLTEGQQAVIATSKYAVRFKLVEWWERVRLKTQ